MSDVLLVNADGPETRVALVENGVLAELHIERPSDRGIIGNIYKGRVARVLPGMQAAFVDIGIDKAAFLYADDISSLHEERQAGGARPVTGPDSLTTEEEAVSLPIQDRLREGQELLVQVAKEPIGSKGARVTSYVSLAGRTLVFMPTVDHVGISRRITDEEERQRLRDVIESLRPPGGGFIVRTVGEHQSEEKLRADMEFLLRLWHDIHGRTEAAPAPSLVYRDLDLTLRTVRDLVSQKVGRLIVDDVAEYERLGGFLDAFMPQFRSALELYQGPEPLFDAFGIEHQIDRALSRKVWLKSGGYLVIDESEALTAIDVNTGRYVGQRNLEDTITKINLEAIRELVSQLRLRNIGGLIIVDFIDMELESNRLKVWRSLLEAMEADRARTNVLPISQLGLVEMTRQRVRDSLAHRLTEPCSYCEGTGFHSSATTVCYNVLRELRRQGPGLAAQRIIVCVHPEVADLLADAEQTQLSKVEQILGKEIIVEARTDFHIERLEIHASLSPGHSG